MIRHVLRSVIVPHGEAVRDVLGKAAKGSAHALSDRFQCLEAGCSRTRMDANTFGSKMIHCDEYGGLTFTGEGGRQIGAPQGVHGVGNDGAIVVSRPTRRPHTPRRQQVRPAWPTSCWWRVGRRRLMA